MSRGSDQLLTALAVGAGIGILNALSFLSAKRGLGVSTAFENLAAQAERRFIPAVTKVNAYLQQREELPKTDWESLLVLGIPLGSFLAARATGEKPTIIIAAHKPPSPVAAFTGGMVMMLGARMAKGCTSGHGITGTSQLALSSLIFTPLMFAMAAVTARLLDHREIA